MPESIARIVARFLEELYAGRPEIQVAMHEESLLGSGLLDSVGAFQLVGAIERAYGIEIPDSDIVPENFDSVRGIEALVARKLAERAVPAA